MQGPDFSSILAAIRNTHLDAVAFVPGPNFRRLFARDFHLMERPLVILLPTKGKPVAVVPNLEMASFSTLAFDGLVFDWRDETGYEDAFTSAALSLPQLAGHCRIGLEARRMRVFEKMVLQNVFPKADFSDAHEIISSIRVRKSADEITYLKKAIKISEAALESTLLEIFIGQTEKEIESILLQKLFSHGADGLSFDPIVAAGDNSAQPHAQARESYKLKRGDALLIDFGAKYKGYNADITRTFFIGEVSDFDRAFYNTVLDANRTGIAATRAGVSAHFIDDTVQCCLEKSKFSEFKRHKTGHGLGLDVHEAPQIMRGNHYILEPGVVFTVEPGLYRLGECGVRIEDNVVVTEDGVDCLTNFSRDLRVICA